MTARITRAADAPEYAPARHDGVRARRLQGHEAGPTTAFWVGMSDYAPAGRAQLGPTAAETVYVVTQGELTLSLADAEGALASTTLCPGDSVHLPAGTVRQVENTSGSAARMIVIIAQPPAAGAGGDPGGPTAGR